MKLQKYISKNYFNIIYISLIAAVIFIVLIYKDNIVQIIYKPNVPVDKMLQQVVQSKKLVSELNLAKIYGEKNLFQVLDPVLIDGTFKEKKSICQEINTGAEENPVYGVFEKMTIDEIGYENQVARGQLYTNHSFDYKERLLQQFLFNNQPLPDDFLERPPFVDQFQNSFAHLLNKNGTKEMKSKKWVEQNLRYFQISELKAILKEYAIEDKNFEILAQLSNQEVDSLVNATSVLLSKDYLLIKNDSRLGFSPLSYLVYKIEDVRPFLENEQFQFSSVSDQSTCLQAKGNICWSYNSKQFLSYLYKYSVLIFILALVILALIIYYAIQSHYKQKRHETKSRLALQILTHEFRTPVSVVLLLIEKISKANNKIDTDLQDQILKISAEAYKLQRILEVSRRYLETQNTDIHFNKVYYESINSWFDDLIAELVFTAGSNNLVVKHLKKDMGFKCDTFWLKFILNNIVQNAFHHGKPPIQIKLEVADGYLNIEVIDYGVCKFNSLDEMTEAFVKSSTSQGMGLGLNMVNFLALQLKINLSFQKDPTCFKLSLLL